MASKNHLSPVAQTPVVIHQGLTNEDRARGTGQAALDDGWQPNEGFTKDRTTRNEGFTRGTGLHSNLKDDDITITRGTNLKDEGFTRGTGLHSNLKDEDFTRGTGLHSNLKDEGFARGTHLVTDDITITRAKDMTHPKDEGFTKDHHLKDEGSTTKHTIKENEGYIKETEHHTTTLKDEGTTKTKQNPIKAGLAKLTGHHKDDGHLKEKDHIKETGHKDTDRHIHPIVPHSAAAGCLREIGCDCRWHRDRAGCTKDSACGNSRGLHHAGCPRELLNEGCTRDSGCISDEGRHHAGCPKELVHRAREGLLTGGNPVNEGLTTGLNPMNEGGYSHMNQGLTTGLPMATGLNPMNAGHHHMNHHEGLTTGLNPLNAGHHHMNHHEGLTTGLNPLNAGHHHMNQGLTGLNPGLTTGLNPMAAGFTPGRHPIDEGLNTEHGQHNHLMHEGPTYAGDPFPHLLHREKHTHDVVKDREPLDKAFTSENYLDAREKGFTTEEYHQPTLKERVVETVHVTKEKLSHKARKGERHEAATALNDHAKQEIDRNRDVTGYAPKASTLPYCDHKHCFEYSPCPVHDIGSRADADRRDTSIADRRDASMADRRDPQTTNTQEQGTWKDKAKHVKDAISHKITGKGHQDEAYAGNNLPPGSRALPHNDYGKDPLPKE